MIQHPLKTEFDQRYGLRAELHSRWEDYAGWTLPYLYPLEYTSSEPEMQRDYQSLGAQCVNHLANKIVMTLFLPGKPFYKLELTPEQQEHFENLGFTTGDIDVLTSRAERESMKRMEEMQLRTSVILCIKSLITLGNSLIYTPTNRHAQVYNLRDYVISRDMSGTPVVIITRDNLIVSTAPVDVQAKLKLKGRKDEDKVSLYTGIIRQPNGSYRVHQEIEDLPGEVGVPGVFPADDLPWNALSWNLPRGSDYGVGLVEDYSGDFHVYSNLSEANLNIASIASDIKILVDPMGNTDVNTLNDSEAGTYVYGRRVDVEYLQLEKLAELQFVDKIMEQYARRLGAGFLLNTGVTRDAERVTAVEIRLQANELEESLGGVYSRLSTDLQYRLARLLLKSTNPSLLELNPVILTGIESLSRNSEHEQIMLLFEDLTILSNLPDEVKPHLKYGDIIKILASNRGLEYRKVLKTDDELESDKEDQMKEQAQVELNNAIAQGAGQQIAGPEGMNTMFNSLQ